MKNITGKILGFVVGTGGFLLLFKVFILPNIPKEDELAPGVVLIIALLIGMLFAFAGSLIQNYFLKRKI